MLLRQCSRIIRQHKFQEIASRDQIAALKYLQTELASTIDHKNNEETKEVSIFPENKFFEIIVISMSKFTNFSSVPVTCLQLIQR